jgi:hypothetical protein
MTNKAALIAFSRHSERLERAYNDGLLAALKDMLYWCKQYQQPLPEWANQALHKTLNELLLGKKKIVSVWHDSHKDYVNYMLDYARHEEFERAREEGIERNESFYIVESLFSKKLKDPPGISATIRDADRRFKKRLEAKPYRYVILHTIQTETSCGFTAETWRYTKDRIKGSKARKPRTIK